MGFQLDFIQEDQLLKSNIIEMFEQSSLSEKNNEIR